MLPVLRTRLDVIKVYNLMKVFCVAFCKVDNDEMRYKSRLLEPRYNKSCLSSSQWMKRVESEIIRQFISELFE